LNESKLKKVSKFSSDKTSHAEGLLKIIPQARVGFATPPETFMQIQSADLHEHPGGIFNHYCPVKKLTKPHQPLLFKG
jgi:hypothetical protein